MLPRLHFTMSLRADAAICLRFFLRRHAPYFDFYDARREHTTPLNSLLLFASSTFANPAERRERRHALARKGRRRGTCRRHDDDIYATGAG